MTLDYSRFGHQNEVGAQGRCFEGPPRSIQPAHRSASRAKQHSRELLPAGNRRRRGEAIRVASVYLLRCADGSLYCGWTTDIQRRVPAPLPGPPSRYTRSRRPVELAAVIPVADRSAALREEARIKRLPRAAKLQLIDATATPR